MRAHPLKSLESSPSLHACAQVMKNPTAPQRVRDALVGAAYLSLILSVEQQKFVPRTLNPPRPKKRSLLPSPSPPRLHATKHYQPHHSAFETYWSALRDFMHGWLPRGGLDEALDASLGADNLHLHNELILCLLNNARCRYLPADLVSQVPASFRGKVVHTTAAVPPAASAATAEKPPPPPPPAIPRRPVPVLNGGSSGSSPPCGKSGLSNGGSGAAAAAAASLPFQGKRAEGLLLNAEGYAVDGSSLSAAPLKTEFGSVEKPATQAPGVAKLETMAARSGLTAAVAPSAGDDAVSSPGGERRRDDDRIPRGERGGVDCLVGAELLSRDAQLLEDEIEASFGTGSDLWHPWSSREEWGSGRLERTSSRGVKRPAPLSQETNSTGCYANERDTKSLKTEGGEAAAAAGGGGSAANGALHCPGEFRLGPSVLRDSSVVHLFFGGGASRNGLGFRCVCAVTMREGDGATLFPTNFRGTVGGWLCPVLSTCTRTERARLEFLTKPFATSTL